VERIINKVAELLGQRLDIAVLNRSRGRVEKGTEYERVPCGRVDTMRAPGAANGGIAQCIKGCVVGDRDDDPILLLGDVLEEFFLEKIKIDDGQGTARSFRSEDIAGA
jgi:hypothetical protein